MKITKDILKKEYIINELSMVEIGNKYNKSNSTIHYNLHKYDIPIRNHYEANKIAFNKKTIKINKIKYKQQMALINLQIKQLNNKFLI